MSLSVIIPSRNAANLVPCVEAVKRCEPSARIIVVDDLHESVPFCEGGNAVMDICDSCNVWWFIGHQPFIFARNCNLGIKIAGADDVVLLNDDALLESPGGFTLMQQAAREYGYGIVSASTNLAGNPDQMRRPYTTVRTARNCPGNSFPHVAYICVLIPRTTINTVGLLDERFGGTTPEGKRLYGYEDNDYSRRVHNAGLKIGIHDGCFVDHNKLHPTFRGDPSKIDMQAARKIYMEKWGTM